MAKFPIPENCSTYVPMILKEFCSSKINGLVMKNIFREIVTIELRNFPKFTTEAACQRNSSETTERR
jgi:regulator of RNase E activity RraA